MAAWVRKASGRDEGECVQEGPGGIARKLQNGKVKNSKAKRDERGRERARMKDEASKLRSESRGEQVGREEFAGGRGCL